MAFVRFVLPASAQVLSTANSGTNSLREVLYSNAPSSTVTFGPGMAGQTISLNDNIIISNSVTLDASSLPGGVQITAVPGQFDGPDGIFFVTNNVTVVLKNIRFINGKNSPSVDNLSGDGLGGAINNNGALTAIGCTFSGNSGVLGGAICNSASGSLNLTQCFFTGNTAPLVSGGAIYSFQGPITLTQCTFSGNSADSEAGAIYLTKGVLTATQCTFSGNSATDNGAGGAIFIDQGTATLNQCTVSGNSSKDTDSSMPEATDGGIYYGGSLTLFNCIVAGNTASFMTPNVAAGFTSLGTNLIDVDPQLNPLSYYGGPLPTMLPKANSPAVDAGADSATNAPYNLTTDQRGLPRRSGAHVDIGAVELLPLAATVTTTADTGAGSLRQAIVGTDFGGSITFDPGLANESIVLTSGELLASRSITIDGSSLSGGVQVNGNKASRILEVASNATVTVNSLTFTNGKLPYTLSDVDAGRPDGGGAILSSGNLTLNRCTVTGNQATTFIIGFGAVPATGGGVMNYGGILTLNQCTVAGNSASNGLGGGLYSGGGVTTLNQSTFTTNTGVQGGGLYNYTNTSPVTLFNCIVAGNATSYSDPNLYGSNGSYTLLGNNLTNGNPVLATLGNHGGLTPTMPPLLGSPAIDAGSDTAMQPPYSFTFDQRSYPRLFGSHVDLGAVEKGEFVTSVADSGPGSLRDAIAAATAGDIILFSANLSGQTIQLASELPLNSNLVIDGSALAVGITLNGGGSSRAFNLGSSANVTLTCLTVTNCYTMDAGGALYSSAGSNLRISRCTFTGNTGQEGGAVLVDGLLQMDNSTFFGNHGQYGGALQCRNNTTLTHCTFSGNDAFYGGGGVFNKYMTLTLNNCLIAGNTPAVDGADIYSQLAALVLVNENYIPNIFLDRPTAGTAGFLPIPGSLRLSPPGNYGGPTQTMPPLFGSAAINTGGATSLSIDQRGFSRVSGSAPDLGAVEVVASSRTYKISPMVKFTNGGFQFGFANAPGTSFSVLAATNVTLPISQWLLLGPAVETPVGSGQFQFIDTQVVNYPQLFYRVHSP